MAKKVTFHDVGQRLSARQLEAIEHVLCWEAGRLPFAYRRFLLKYNGGCPEPAHFKWQDKDGEEQESEVYDFLGLDPGRLDAKAMDCLRATLHYRSQLPRYAIVIAHLDLDDLLLLFTAGAREGQAWIWSNSGAELAGWNLDPENNIDFVSQTFSAFLRSLYRPVIADPYRPVTIALDSPRVRGKRLETILERLGCKKWRYPGVLYSATPLPAAWRWPRFQSTSDVGATAFLSVEKNKTYGFAPKFDQRPVGHKMLRVNVTGSQRSRCIRELTDALGEGAYVLDGE